MKEKNTIGSAEFISFPEQGLVKIPARIDTGARNSAIWASDVRVKDDILEFVLFDKLSPLYTGEVLSTSNFTQLVVATSTGHRDTRYKVKLLVVVKDRKIRASFTLANRSTQVYPVLVGRNVLRGKFLVDVKLGKPLTAKENQRIAELQNHLLEGNKNQ